MTQPPSYGPPQPPPPGWGPPPGYPYGPPPPKKGIGTGVIVAITLGSIFGALILIVAISSLLATSPNTRANPTRHNAAPEPATEDPLSEEPTEEATVTLAATKTTFKPSILHNGGSYTSIKVTITNHGDEPIRTNPLRFSITDTTGTKHAAELGIDENQMDLLTLAKGEKATGVITGKGAFTPAYVTYTENPFGSNGIRSDVK